MKLWQTISQFADHVVDVVVDWIFREDTTFLEFLYAFLAFAWGLWLLSPFWDTFADLSIYRVMAEAGGELGWGLVPTLMGAIWMWAIFQNNYYARRNICLVLMVFWALAAAAFFAASPFATSTIIYPFLAFGHAWIFWRLGLRRV